jgi:hypothetical protein
MSGNSPAKEEGSDPPPITFEQLKQDTATDLRAVAGYIMERATAVEGGDLGAMDRLLDDELIRWREMLLIRFAVKREDMEAAR